MLKTIRVLAAAICFSGLVLLFVDVSGFAPENLAFLAKFQLVPAVLAGSLGAAGVLLAASLAFGRIYCSTICPLGVMQDVLARLKPKRRYRFAPSRAWLRPAALALFILAFAAGLPLIFGLLEPYSAFGRIAADIFAPVWAVGSNGLALAAERMDSFAVGLTPVWQKGFAALAAAIATLAVLGVLAWRGGRTWCNTLCPVGTFLGQINRVALIRPRLDREKCVHCGNCERVCKARCIDAETGTLDAGRCVSCFNCLKTCRKDALAWRPSLNVRPGLERVLFKCLHALQGFAAQILAARCSQEGFARRYASTSNVIVSRQAAIVAAPQGERAAPRAMARHFATDTSRRAFFSGMGFALGTAALPLSALAAAREAVIPALTRKISPERAVPVLPPGAGGLASFTRKCTGCQLCVTACPHQALRSSDIGGRALQPAMGFERGYCRVNCVTCSSVCPTGAVRPISVEQKSALQIGRAVVHTEICIVTTDDVSCTACAKACPPGAISLAGADGTRKRPVVDTERCIGCGACEYVCPARPVSAVMVEGNLEHRMV
ncbi:MAG: 4Fe-4S dicluster domain-containing protein [Deltaproteobacteria bacterium]|jgi:ferredoxin|nr:4Fe-4S dicluster domain-containing protein [Deltaproteobacteria bacterium]